MLQLKDRWCLNISHTVINHLEVLGKVEPHYNIEVKSPELYEKMRYVLLALNCCLPSTPVCP